MMRDTVVSSVLRFTHQPDKVLFMDVFICLFVFGLCYVAALNNWSDLYSL